MDGPTRNEVSGGVRATSSGGPASAPARTIEEVIAQMEALSGVLPSGDGISHFNQMYLLVTQMVQGAVAGADFSDAEFLSRLDVEFANRYLRAVALSQTEPKAMPRCWRVLHDRRWSTHIAPIQFAVAGMNAHINHDLVLSLVSTWEQLDQDPSHFHADFTLVNRLLASMENAIRRSFEAGLLLRLDQAFGPAGHHVDMWSISAARAAAWHDAHLIWRVRTHDGVRAKYQHYLDHAVASVSECLLLPAAAHHAKHDGQSAACSSVTSFLPIPH